MKTELTSGTRRVAALDASSAAGRSPCLLFVHGAGGNLHSYDLLLPHLGEHRHFVPALPGRSGTEGPPLGTLAGMAVWLAELLRARKLGPVVVCGHSLGGLLAMVLASVLGRLMGFNLRGSDAYAGYCMAAAAFLALAHTLKSGEHIRVNLFLQRFGPRLRTSRLAPPPERR